MKRTLALLLAVLMVVGLFAGCGSDDTPSATAAPDSTAPTTIWDTLDAMDHDEASDMVYEWAFSDFADAYAEAKAEVTDTDLRMALMAKAEAKLLESGIMVPVQSNGGNYAITSVVPRSSSTVLWGLDEYKWSNVMVTNELLTAADRETLIGMWSAAESADAYLEQAEAFLTENGYTLSDTYNFLSPYELVTWDVIATSNTSDSYFISATYTGLVEYDNKNVAQPAMAESWEVSDDGLTYTFHIREGVNWVDQQGRVVAPVTAKDWVTSMMHLVDNNDALGYLMSADGGCGIKNYDAFINGDVTDFSEVGVQAVDDYTLVYTLEAPFPAFVSMMGYGCFAPLNYEFYKSQGGTFSAEGDVYTSGNYGTSPSTIAYNGPYLVTNFTAKNVTTYGVNPEYYDPDAINVSVTNIYFNDGTDTTRAFTDLKAGTISGAGMNATCVELAKQETPEGETETYFDLYAYVSSTDGSTFCGWVNLNRGTWTNYNDTSVGVSTQTEADAFRTRVAVNNWNFRMALATAFDRGAYVGVSLGEELKYTCVRNSYVPGTFMSLAADTTIDINGASVTFPAGTYYGEIVQAQIDADGIPLKVWDPEADGGVGSSDGFEGWYNPEVAAQYLEAAIAELAEEGVEVSAENPIYIDVPAPGYSETGMQQKQAYKQSIEGVLGGCVIVNLVSFDNSTNYSNAYYRINTGDEANYDSAPSATGWGPDYGDPQTYLDTMIAYGYMTKNFGLY